MRGLLLFALTTGVAACGGGSEFSDPDGDADADGGGDGGESDIDSMLESLEGCAPLPEGDRLDLLAGCADDACAGDTYADWVTALGGEGDCTGGFGPNVNCTWTVGISGTFPDADDDDVPDSDGTTMNISLAMGYDGATDDGLGMNISPVCFLEALGATDVASFTRLANGEWAIEALEWRDLGLTVNDGGGFGGGGPFGRVTDGLVDLISASGAPQN